MVAVKILRRRRRRRTITTKTICLIHLIDEYIIRPFHLPCMFFSVGEGGVWGSDWCDMDIASENINIFIWPDNAKNSRKKMVVSFRRISLAPTYTQCIRNVYVLMQIPFLEVIEIISIVCFFNTRIEINLFTYFFKDEYGDKYLYTNRANYNCVCFLKKDTITQRYKKRWDYVGLRLITILCNVARNVYIMIQHCIPQIQHKPYVGLKTQMRQLIYFDLYSCISITIGIKTIGASIWQYPANTRRSPNAG